MLRLVVVVVVAVATVTRQAAAAPVAGPVFLDLSGICPPSAL